MPESEAQKQTIGRVMHEAKRGTLRSGAGGVVRSRKQAIAIALREAGASRDQAAAEGSRAALYAEATRRGIRGRSRMRKADLARALSR